MTCSISRRLALAFLVLTLSTHLAAANDSPSAPLLFFDDYIGAWGPAPDDPMLKERPEMADFVAFLFEWAGDDKKILRFYEGVPGGDTSRRILECLVTVHPRDGTIVFLGYQARNDFLYEGSFEPLDDGFVRLYDVTYPRDYELKREEDRRAGKIRYRDVCRLLAVDTLECRTEQLRDGEWTPWGSGGAYTLVRRRSDS